MVKINRFINEWLTPVAGYFYKQNIKCINIIYYHDVCEERGGTYDRVLFSIFKKQMQWLLSAGYQTIKFSQIDCQENNNNILITFDDGWRSNYEVIFDFMKKNYLYYNVFLSPGLQDKEPEKYLTWEMVEEMSDSGLVEFGAHTYDHLDARLITECNWDRQIEEANQEISKHTGRMPQDFCFPYGYYNKNTLENLLAKKPYKRVYTSDCHLPKYFDGVTVFGRFGINNCSTMRHFRNTVKGYYFIREKIKILKRAIYELQKF